MREKISFLGWSTGKSLLSHLAPWAHEDEKEKLSFMTARAAASFSSAAPRPHMGELAIKRALCAR
jgi:hypothetical protein